MVSEHCSRGYQFYSNSVRTVSNGCPNTVLGATNTTILTTVVYHLTGYLYPFHNQCSTPNVPYTTNNQDTLISIFGIMWLCMFIFSRFTHYRFISSSIASRQHIQYTEMSDYYWQRKVVTATQIDWVSQIRYSVHATDTPDLIQVKETNINKKTPSVAHTVYLPSHYKDQVIHFLWRFYLLITLYDHYHKNKKTAEFARIILAYISHLNNVIEALIRPFQRALSIPGQTHPLPTANSRSWNFEEFLITEFLIRQHAHKYVRRLREGCPTPIEKMNWDDFGKSYVNLKQCIHSHIG